MLAFKKKDFEELMFFLKVFLVYAGWKAFAHYINIDHGRTVAWQRMLVGYEAFYAGLTSYLLRLLGYPSSSDSMYVFIDKAHNMWVAEHCLAIPAMVIFAFSMVLFKGRTADKVWFIPFGMVFIFLINLVRLVSLGILRAHLEEASYQVYHRYVFLVLTYAAILAMVVWWMDRTMKKGQATDSGAEEQQVFS